MKKLECYIRPSRVEAVLAALTEEGIDGISISHVKGHGKQGGYTEFYRGATRKVQLLEKVRIDIVLSPKNVKKVVQIIVKEAKSSEEGEVGDGKIFVLPVEDAIRIRTGEKGTKAIN